MKKALLIMIGIGALLVAIAAVLYKSNTNQPIISEQIGGDSYVSTSSVPVPTESTIPIATQSLEKFTVVNFLNNDSVTADSQNPGLFYLGNTFLTSPGGETPTYVITYDVDSQFFTVVLLAEPLMQSRADAEFYLGDILNISNKQLCALRYSVAVPLYIDKDLSGNDLKFSFCPNNIEL